MGAQIPGILSGLIKRPFLSELIEIDPQFRQKSAEGYRVLSVDEPFVATMMKPNDYTPRFPRLIDQMNARKSKIPVISLSDVGFCTVKKLSSPIEFFLPPQKERGHIFEEKNADETLERGMEVLIAERIL